MAMATSVAELRSMTDEQLIAIHDKIAQSTVVGTNHYLEELGRRDQQRSADAVVRMTKHIRDFTFVMTFCTVVILALTVVLVSRGG